MKPRIISLEKLKKPQREETLQRKAVKMINAMEQIDTNSK